MKILTTCYHAHSIEGGKTYFHYYVPKDLKEIFGLRNNYNKREILFDNIMSNTIFGNQVFTDHLFKNFLKVDNSLNIVICNLFMYQKIVEFLYNQDFLYNDSNILFDIESLFEKPLVDQNHFDEFKIEVVPSMPDRITDC